jgi:hypothetical protein
MNQKNKNNNFVIDDIKAIVRFYYTMLIFTQSDI